MEKSTISTGAPGNDVNDALSKAVRNFSKFNLVRRRYETMRFGDITPHLVLDGVSTDVLPLQSSHDLRTYTLSNILMSDVKMHKEYFAVNWDAILPNHWEKVYKNPLRGDDVTSDVNSCVPIKLIASSLQACIEHLSYLINDFGVFGTYTVPEFMLCLSYLEMFCSSGCLTKYLGTDFSSLLVLDDGFFEELPQYSALRHKDFNVIDWFFDVVCGELRGYGKNFYGAFYSVDGDSDDNPMTSYWVDVSLSDSSDKYFLCFRDWLQRIREQPYFSFYWSDNASDLGISDVIVKFVDNLSVVELSESFDEVFNFGREAAYQLVCAEFYSNDHIDYVYSAELFVQLQRSLADSAYVTDGENGLPNFDWNGVRSQYDALSGRVLGDMIGKIVTNEFNLGGSTVRAAAYIYNLFGYRRSLRYRDYFVGAHATPLALGDTNVAVNNNLVSVIDTTKGIASQRFLNQVARIGQKIENYLKGLFPGARVEKDIHQPLWLARTDHDVRPVENENTAAAQYELDSSVTSVLRSGDNRYIFEFNVGRPSLILGVTYYDVPRAYPRTIDLLTLAADRYDMFIPELQFIGDQPIRSIELGRFDNSVFAYTLRDMQYKQLFDIACGGFVDNLPGWCFLAPSHNPHISPSFIRSSNCEFDKYFLSLSGYSLAHYFHFILYIKNEIEARRPMAYAPSIL